MGEAVRWRTAMAEALYGEAGFFVRGVGGTSGRSPTRENFWTSAHASPLFATALLRLVVAVDEALERPDPLDVVDVGAGTGDLLRRIAVLAPAYLRQRLQLRAVELAAPPADLPGYIDWRDDLPEPGMVTGVLLATEWLDNVPLDIAETGADGRLRYLLVDPENGEETLGDEVEPAHAEWAARWWPLPPGQQGIRVELGTTRDEAWAAAVRSVSRGLALTVDYGHTRAARPRNGTLTGFLDGRDVPAIPDGTRDITAHVAFDAICSAGEEVAGRRALLTTQRDALRALGLDGTRPPRSLATDDPTGYVQALSAATQAAELLDPTGLGGHLWLLQRVRLPASALPADLRSGRAAPG